MKQPQKYKSFGRRRKAQTQMPKSPEDSQAAIIPAISATKTPAGLLSCFFSAAKTIKLLRGFRSRVIRFLQIKVIKWPYQLIGIKFLNKQKTEHYLQPYLLSYHQANTILLPKVIDPIDLNKHYYTQIQAETEPVHVWSYTAKIRKTRQLPYGGLIINNRMLCTDTNTEDFYRNVLHRPKRVPFHTKTLIAPWSHFMDGFVWRGYYDFLFLVVGKLCRIKDSLPESVFNQAIIAYPLVNTSYEKEYLSLLSIDIDRVINSQTHTITFDECILADVGHWFYPNAADILSLRKHIRRQVPIPEHFEGNRIYISRVGRRRIQNEDELISLLKKYDFQIIEDRPRSVIEQIEIYQNADFIIGPHGASFSNILWCRPETHLLELFSATYAPDHFRYLAELLGLRYSAYRYGSPETGPWWKGLENDIYVDTAELNQCLTKLFGR